MESDYQNILSANTREKFREWLSAHYDTEQECWVEVKHGRPVDDNYFWYLDVVEEALCFGWIDSQHKAIGGRRMQRFTPRKKNSPWTEPPRILGSSISPIIRMCRRVPVMNG